MRTNVQVIYVQIPEPVKIGGMTISPLQQMFCVLPIQFKLFVIEKCVPFQKLCVCMSSSNKHLLKKQQTENWFSFH